jgi:uncharacterized membrane protein YhaH (DUF805 family)
MLGAIKYNLTHLLDFRGRDARQTFWYYVLFLVVLQFLASMMMTIPIMIRIFRTVFEQTQAGAPPEVVQAQMQVQMGSIMGDMLWVSITLGVLFAALLLAAFVRRLHDSDKSGWWAALAVAGQAAGLVVSIRVAGMMRELMPMMNDPANMQQVMAQQQHLSAYSLAGWIAPAVVIGFGILRSTDGPNKYGDEPVRF